MAFRKYVALVAGVALVSLLVGGCDLRATESPGSPSPAVPMPDTPAPTSLPVATKTVTAASTPGFPRWHETGWGIPAQLGIASVAVAPSNPQVIYLAAYEPGDLYRSEDRGQTWQPANGGLELLAPIALAVHPTDPSAAWVGTVIGAYQTSDGGQNWHSMTGLPQFPIYALTTSPDGANLYAAGEAPGVWFSNDGGGTWQSSRLAEAGGSVLSLAVAADGTIFAGTAGQGLWTSRDAGKTWQAVSSALASTHVTVLYPLEENGLYALADKHPYLSRDGGDTWRMVGPPEFEALSFAVEPGPTDRLYLGSKGLGVAVSEDSGESWTLLGGKLRHADITCLTTDPAKPGRVYLGTRYNGLYRTADAGESWSLVSRDLGRQVVAALAQDPTDPQVLYAGTLDGVYRSEDGGGEWSPVGASMGRLFVQGLALGPEGKLVYAGTQSGIFVSEDGGDTWRWAEDDTGRMAVFNVVIDPLDAKRVYAGSWGHNVMRTTDGGQTWAPIHHGLETLSVHAFAIEGVDSAGMPSALQVLYAGTVEAVYRNIDGGETWQASFLTDRSLSTLALTVQPASPGVVYAGTTEGVYRSADSGQIWKAAGHESLDATVTALAVDRSEPYVLYAGTEHRGLFRSTDGGQHWQPWGLDGASVYAILVESNGVIWLGTDQGIFKGP